MPYKWEHLSAPTVARLRRRGVATMTYVDWFDHDRLHGEVTDDAAYTTPRRSRRQLLSSDGHPPRPAPHIHRSHAPARFIHPYC